MANPPAWQAKPAAFIEDLVCIEAEKSGRSRRIMADLKRCLSQPESPVLVQHIARWVKREQGWRRFCFCAGAALFALHPLTAADGNLGAHLAQLPRPTPSLDDRVRQVLDVERTVVYRHILSWVRRLKSAGVAINYPTLIADLMAWGHPSKFVQRSWTHSYFTAGVIAPDTQNPIHSLEVNHV